MEVVTPTIRATGVVGRTGREWARAADRYSDSVKAGA